MKKQYIILLLTLLICSSCRGETNLLSLIPDTVSKLKKGIVPPTDTIELVYDYSTRNISELKNAYPQTNSVILEDYFESNKTITRKQLIKILNLDKNFVLLRNCNVDYGGGTAESSYRKVFRKKQVIGEVVFYAPYFHTEVGNGFGYGLSYLDGSDIFYFALSVRMMDKDMYVFSSLPEIFIKKNGTWHWKNGNQSVTDLHNLMLSRDSRLPKVFIELQDTWDNIISNLEIDGVKVEVR